MIYWYDDFDTVSWGDGNVPSKWVVVGAVEWTPIQGPNHFGLVRIPGAPNGLIANGPDRGTLTQNGGASFSVLQEAAIRFVVACDNVPEIGNAEWFCGWFNDPSQEQAGALFSSAQGYSSLPGDTGGIVSGADGLLCGTYDTVSGGRYGYVQSGYQPKPNVWMDLRIVYTPTAVKFYAGDYDPDGTAPPLVGTCVNNICSDYSIYPLIYASAGSTTNLYLDLVEVLYVPIGSNRLAGASMLS